MSFVCVEIYYCAIIRSRWIEQLQSVKLIILKTIDWSNLLLNQHQLKIVNENINEVFEQLEKNVKCHAMISSNYL